MILGMIPKAVWQSLGIILAILLVLWALRSPGKKGAHKIPDVNGGNLNPATDYAAIATQLFNAFSGLDWTSTKARAINRHMALNDDEFKQVYIVYNRVYKTPPDTLKTDFDGEFIFGAGPSAYADRFERLQLP